MPARLRYASVTAEVVCMRYRAPASYQSRPPHPPSPAAVRGALARAAAEVGGERAWLAILKGRAWCTYTIVEPLSGTTLLTSRLLPPEQRKVKGLGVASADPVKKGFRRPSNVFPVGEYLGGTLRLTVVYDPGTVPEELVIKSLLGVRVLGDNDSLVSPKATTLDTGQAHILEAGSGGAVVTNHVFRLRDASPVEGSWILAKLPTELGPRELRDAVRVERHVFEDVVIPARRLGEVLEACSVRARLAGGVAVRAGGDALIVPAGVVGA